MCNNKRGERSISQQSEHTYATNNTTRAQICWLIGEQTSRWEPWRRSPGFPETSFSSVGAEKVSKHRNRRWEKGRALTPRVGIQSERRTERFWSLIAAGGGVMRNSGCSPRRNWRTASCPHHVAQLSLLAFTGKPGENESKGNVWRAAKPTTVCILME